MNYTKSVFFILAIISICGCVSCTYTVSMAHTQGTADDVIDDTATNTPNIAPNVTIPMTPGSSVGIGK